MPGPPRVRPTKELRGDTIARGPVRGTVQGGHRNNCATGVERAYDADDVFVSRVLAGVRLTLRVVVLPGAPERVVAGLVRDTEPACTKVALAHDECDGLCHLGRRDLDAALQREIRHDEQVCLFALAGQHRLADSRWERGDPRNLLRDGGTETCDRGDPDGVSVHCHGTRNSFELDRARHGHGFEVNLGERARKRIDDPNRTGSDRKIRNTQGEIDRPHRSETARPRFSRASRRPR